MGVKRTQLNLALGEVEDGGGSMVLVQTGQVWIHGCGKKGIKGISDRQVFQTRGMFVRPDEGRYEGR